MKITIRFVCISILIFSLTLKSSDYQQHYFGKQNDPSYLFCAPIQFTRNGMQFYLKTIFNDVSYSQDFLPYSFTHFIQFLEYGKDQAFVEHALRLFSNKIKAAPYISDGAFIDMLNKVPQIIKKQVLKEYDEINFDHIQNSVNNTLYDMFLTRFAVFKQEPETFLHDLSKDLVKKVDAIYCLEDRMAQERLLQMLVRFFDAGTLKLMWNVHDQMKVWDSVKKISNQFSDLFDQNMLTSEDLDDLYRSLIERFCYFLDLAGSELAIDVIKKIKEDIVAGDILLFQLEEQEELLEPRGDRLMHVILQTEAKIEAKKYGIVTDLHMYDEKQ